MTESVEKLRDLLETKRNYLRKEIVDYKAKLGEEDYDRAFVNFNDELLPISVFVRMAKRFLKIIDEAPDDNKRNVYLRLVGDFRRDIVENSIDPSITLARVERRCQITAKAKILEILGED